MSPATRRVILANLLVPVIAWIVWDQYERRAFARDVAALAARGEPTSADALATGGDTPERYQAARVYAAAAEHVRALAPDLTFRLPRIDVDSLAVVANLDQLERSYPHHAPAIQLLEQAAPLDFNGFGDLTRDVDRPALLTLGYLGLLHADLLSARGNADAAAHAVAACVRLLRTLELFPRAQLAARMLGSLRILLRHGSPSREALTALLQAFISLSDGDGLVDDVRSRRVRFLDDAGAPSRTLTDAAVRLALRPWVARSNRQQLAGYDEVQALAAGAWPQKLVTAQRAIDRNRYAEGTRRVRQGLFERQTFPPGIAYLGFGVRQAASEVAARRVGVAVVAVELFRHDRSGALPESIAVLVPEYVSAVPLDPFTGRAVAYVATPVDYRVYSVDQDMKDDAGAVYGLGSKGDRPPQPGQPRDLGIRVELQRQR